MGAVSSSGNGGESVTYRIEERHGPHPVHEGAQHRHEDIDKPEDSRSDIHRR